MPNQKTKPAPKTVEELDFKKTLITGLALGVLASIVTAIFTPSGFELAFAAALNPGGVFLRLLIILACFIVVVGFGLKRLGYPHPFRNAFYVPFSAQCAAIILAYEKLIFEQFVFLLVLAACYVGAQFVWNYVARANKLIQSVYVIAVILLFLVSIRVSNTGSLF